MAGIHVVTNAVHKLAVDPAVNVHNQLGAENSHAITAIQQHIA